MQETSSGRAVSCLRGGIPELAGTERSPRRRGVDPQPRLVVDSSPPAARRQPRRSFDVSSDSKKYIAQRLLDRQTDRDLLTPICAESKKRRVTRVPPSRVRFVLWTHQTSSSLCRADRGPPKLMSSRMSGVPTVTDGHRWSPISLVSCPDRPPLHTWKVDLTLRLQENVALVQTSPLKHPLAPAAEQRIAARFPRYAMLRSQIATSRAGSGGRKKEGLTGPSSSAAPGEYHHAAARRCRHLRAARIPRSIDVTRERRCAGGWTRWRAWSGLYR